MTSALESGVRAKAALRVASGAPTRVTSSSAVEQSAIEDTDGYERSVHGVSIRSVRTGQGFAPNEVTAIKGASSLVMDVATGFPMLNRTTLDDDRLVAAYIRRAPPGAAWSGFDLDAGSAVLYGPGARHVGVNPARLAFAFVAVGLDEMEAMAEDIRLRVALPPPGSVALRRPEQAGGHGKRLAEFISGAQISGIADRQQEEDLLVCLLRGFAEAESLVVRRTRLVDRCSATYTCVEYAESIGRIPSIRELCLAAGVSDRTLRLAFAEAFGISPGRFFRLWALNQARSRLALRDAPGTTVSRVATDLGFFHLGRFAGQYQRLHGELPSVTLRGGRQLW